MRPTALRIYCRSGQSAGKEERSVRAEGVRLARFEAGRCSHAVMIGGRLVCDFDRIGKFVKGGKREGLTKVVVAEKS